MPGLLTPDLEGRGNGARLLTAVDCSGDLSGKGKLILTLQRHAIGKRGVDAFFKLLNNRAPRGIES
jgi:hypothetical protein